MSEFKTEFSPGDTAWCITADEIELLTVGRVSVQLTESRGYEDTIFDNYKPHEREYKEKYMCIETGIGSGYVYTLGENIFRAIDDAKKALVIWRRK